MKEAEEAGERVLKLAEALGDIPDRPDRVSAGILHLRPGEDWLEKLEAFYEVEAEMAGPGRK